MMMRKPASDAMEIALIDAGRRGESARPRAAKRERSMSSAARRRKNEVDGGGAAESIERRRLQLDFIESHHTLPTRSRGLRGFAVSRSVNAATARPATSKPGLSVYTVARSRDSLVSQSL